ncbi:MAG: DNA primase [Candidatus Omnitrophica bacterium]|nr:DNA primase [Candidatus Omnitrophota bacterium]
MAIPQQILDEIQERTDIVSLISSYIPLKKSGRNFRALCPFHSEKTPSFFVNPNRQIFHCFGCGAGGGAIQFVMQHEKVGFVEAVEMLAKRLGVQIPKSTSPQDSLKTKAYAVNKEASSYFHKNLFLSQGKFALEYLKKRGITEETLKEFKIGYASAEYKSLLQYMRSKGESLSILDKVGLVTSTRDGSFIDLFRNRIMFPIFDVKSRVIGFGARRLVEDKNVPKYINTPESLLYHKGSTLFGINLAKESILKKDSCLIVEGYLDMMVPFQYGITNILASLGTALTVEQIRMIKRYTNNIVLVFDSDSAGKTSSLRAIDSLIEQDLNIKAVSLPSGFDPDNFIREKGKDEFLRLLEDSEDFFLYKLNILIERFNINEVKEKSDLLLEMLSTLLKFNNQLIRYEYLKKLARRLDTKEEFLLAEFKKLDSRQRSPRAFTAHEPEKRDVYQPEEYLIRCILCDKNVFEIIKEVIGPDDFAVPILRRIFEECFNSWTSHNDLEINRILAGVNGQVGRKISQLLVEEFVLKEEVLNECILKVKRNSSKIKKQFLKEQIRKAEEAKDTENLTSLISEYQNLIKQEKPQ